MDYMSLSVAALLGICTYRHLPVFLRVLFWQLVFYIAIHILAGAVISYQRSQGLPANNHFVYNIGMLAECCFLFAAACVYFSSFRAVSATIIGFLVFLAVYVVESRKKGFVTFANYAYATECICVVIVYTAILFDQFQLHHVHWHRSPVVLSTLGILVYFICNVPYLTLIEYFQQKNPLLNAMLFEMVRVFSHIRYILLALAFWRVRHNIQLLRPRFNG